MTDPVTLDGQGSIGEFDEKRAEAAVRELLLAVGEDPDREGLRETPGRVARAYKEIFAGLYQQPEDVLTTTFDLGHDEMVLVKDIEVFSTCEHHLVPFRASRTSATSPPPPARSPACPSWPGWSTLYARRPQVQERLTTQIAESLMSILSRAASSSSSSASTCACRCAGSASRARRLLTSAVCAASSATPQPAPRR